MKFQLDGLKIFACHGDAHVEAFVFQSAASLQPTPSCCAKQPTTPVAAVGTCASGSAVQTAGDTGGASTSPATLMGSARPGNEGDLVMRLPSFPHSDTNTYTRLVYLQWWLYDCTALKQDFAPSPKFQYNRSLWGPPPNPNFSKLSKPGHDYFIDSPRRQTLAKASTFTIVSWSVKINSSKRSYYISAELLMMRCHLPLVNFRESRYP